MRQIDETMFNELLNGKLSPILDAVKRDDTLDLELRGEAVNVYYRGGSLFKITNNNGKLDIYFNPQYCIAEENQLTSPKNAEEAVANIPFYKQAMDFWFHKHPKYEREFQQLIVRENNNTGNIARGTDYFIIDIEYADTLEKKTKSKSYGARFDIVALKWQSNGASRKNSKNVTLSLIEVKYGDGALKNDAGVGKHLDDFNKFLSDKEKFEELCDDMAVVFKQKCSLGLIDGIKEHQLKDFSINCQSPEVIFIFANHDPDSKVLDGIFTNTDLKKYPFPVMIANSSNMGYCLYTDRMKRLN